MLEEIYLIPFSSRYKIGDGNILFFEEVFHEVRLSPIDMGDEYEDTFQEIIYDLKENNIPYFLNH